MDSKPTKTTITEAFIKEQRDTICFENYTMEIVSEIINESTENNQKHFFPVACLKQKLVFSKNGNIIKEEQISVSKIEYVFSKGRKYDIQENEIIYIGIVKGKEDFLYSLIGDGGCNECSELYALYSKTGELLYLDYFEKDSIFNQFGSLNDELNKIGASESNFFKYRNKQILNLN